MHFHLIDAHIIPVSGKGNVKNGLEVSIREKESGDVFETFHAKIYYNADHWEIIERSK